MKIDRDFKHEVDTEVSEGWYVAKKILVKGAIVVVIATVFFGGISFASKMAATNADRVIFKQSVTYNEGMLDDLAKYQYEYNSADDDVEKNAIVTLVRNRFANFDKSKIENYDLLKFLEECGV